MSDEPDVVYVGERFSVHRVAVPRRDGGTQPRSYLVHPGAVVVLPILKDGRVVMIRNTRFTVQDTLLELPAGTLEAGEDPILCAGRELLEETGYRAAHISPLMTFYSAPGVTDERMHGYVAEGLSEAEQSLDATEQIEVVTMSFDELDAAMRAGDIVNGSTLAMLLYYRRFRRPPSHSEALSEI